MSLKGSPPVAMLLALVALVGASFVLFWLADFCLTTPVAQVTTEAQPYFVGLRHGERLTIRGPLTIWTTGSSPLVGAVERSLVEILAARNAYEEVRVADVVTERVAGPLLEVRLAKAGGLWTPLVARSEVELVAGYASDGGVAWLDSGEVVIAASADPVARIRIRLVGRYEAIGLQSRTGYYRAVAGLLVERLLAELAAQLAGG